MEKKLINKFRVESLKQLKSLRADEIVLLDETPIQENVTIIIKPSEECKKTILKLISGLKVADDTQFYYPVDRFHLTILGNIPISVDIKSHVNSIYDVLKKQKMKFKLFGIGSNQFTSSVSAYPLDFSIHALRDEIRQIINNQADNYSRILEYYEYVGWINYMRYLKHPDQEFLDKLFSYKDFDFGEMIVSKVQIFKTTSKLIDPSQSILISEFDV